MPLWNRGWNVGFSTLSFPAHNVSMDPPQQRPRTGFGYRVTLILRGSPSLNACTCKSILLLIGGSQKIRLGLIDEYNIWVYGKINKIKISLEIVYFFIFFQSNNLIYHFIFQIFHFFHFYFHYSSLSYQIHHKRRGYKIIYSTLNTVLLWLLDSHGVGRAVHYNNFTCFNKIISIYNEVSFIIIIIILNIWSHGVHILF